MKMMVMANSKTIFYFALIVCVRKSIDTIVQKNTAAIALVIAYRRWLMLHRLCHRLQVLSGANIRPPRHMLPKAAWPDRWVPPPRTRGIRAT